MKKSELRQIIKEELFLNEKFDWRGGKAFIAKYCNELSRINDYLRNAITAEDVDKVKNLLDSIIKKTNELKKNLKNS